MSIEKLIYQIRNIRSVWRAIYLGSYIVIEGIIAEGLGATAGRIRATGTVGIKLTRANPKWWQRRVVDYGTVSWRVITTAGVNYLRDNFNNGTGSANVANFKYHACGTGAVAENITDTALGAECTTVLNPDSTRAVGSQAGATAKTYVTVGTLTFDGGASVTEHGLFSAASTGTLWDRSVFASIGAVAADSIQFTYTLTISDGG